MTKKLLVLVALIMVATFVFVGCEEIPALDQKPTAPTPQPVKYDPLKPMTGLSDYAGTDSCVMCHADAMKDWEGTWHTMKAMPGFTYGKEYMVNYLPWVFAKWDSLDTHMILDRKDASTIYVTAGEYDWKEVDWIIGSTRKQRYAVYYDGGPRKAYLSTTKDGGISWTIDKTQVVDFPGNPDRAGYKFLTLENRPNGNTVTYGEFWSWQERCIACHTTGFDAAAWDQAKEDFKAGKREDLREIFVADSRVACEACHGAGKEHVKNPMAPGKIINPAKLDKNDPTRKMVCEQCHTRTAARNTLFPGKDNAPNDFRGFVLGQHDYMDVQTYQRPAWGKGSRAVSIDGKGRRDHQQDMDIRLQDHIYGRTTVHGSMACFDCHAAHTVGKNPSNKSIKGTKKEDSCITCHGDKTADYLKVLNGRTGWPSYKFGEWGGEGGRAGASSHVFNMDDQGRSYAVSPDKYVWALKKDADPKVAASWDPIWPWEQDFFKGQGRTVKIAEKPWE